MKKMFILLSLAILILSGCGSKTDLTEEQLAIKEENPEFFDIDSTKGLDVIVWQMAEDDYHFAVFDHTETVRDTLSDDYLKYGLSGDTGVDAEQMKSILSTYDVKEDDIYVIPWQNPISSYLCDYWIAEDYKTKQDYIISVRRMLGI